MYLSFPDATHTKLVCLSIYISQDRNNDKISCKILYFQPASDTFYCHSSQSCRYRQYFITNICSCLVHIELYIIKVVDVLDRAKFNHNFFHFLLIPSSSSSSPLSKEELIDFLIWFNFLYTFPMLIMLKNTFIYRKTFSYWKKKLHHIDIGPLSLTIFYLNAL